MASKYTNEDITVLDDLEHMRLRRGMYIGEADNPKQLISEIIDNALDEVQEGYSDELIVTVNTKDNILQLIAAEDSLLNIRELFLIKHNFLILFSAVPFSIFKSPFFL